MVGAPIEVLLVEDQPADAKLVEIALSGEPPGRFHLRRASRVAEATERLAAGGVDVVVTDLGLPDSSGADAVRRLKAAASGVPIVVLSGSEDSERLLAAFANGAVAFEVKGVFPPGYLGRRLESAIRMERVVGRLADPAWHAEANSAEWSELPEPAALLVDGRLAASTPAMEPYLDRSTPSAVSLVDSLREEAALRSSAGGAVPPPAASTEIGECRVRSPDGRGRTIRYVVRAGEAGGARRVLLLIREADRPLLSPRPSPRSPPASAGGHATAPLDPVAWAELRELAGDNPRFLSDLAAAYVADAAALVAELERASAPPELRALERAAHALKSSSSQVAALRLAEMCRGLEARSRSGEAATAAGDVSAIAAEFRRVAEALQAVVRGGARTSGRDPGERDP